jgi:hypothetical protein
MFAALFIAYGMLLAVGEAVLPKSGFALQLLVGALTTAVGVCLVFKLKAAWYLALCLIGVVIVSDLLHANRLSVSENLVRDGFCYLAQLAMYAIALRYLTLPRIRSIFSIGSSRKT